MPQGSGIEIQAWQKEMRKKNKQKNNTRVDTCGKSKTACPITREKKKHIGTSEISHRVKRLLKQIAMPRILN